MKLVTMESIFLFIIWEDISVLTGKSIEAAGEISSLRHLICREEK